MLKSLYPLAQMFARPLWWAITPPARGAGGRRGERRRVLLVYYNKLTARYVKHVAEILKDDPRVELVVTRAPFVDRESEVDDFDDQQSFNIPHIPFVHALTKWWDLVVFADHYPAVMFHPSIPKVFVTHGMFAGRRFGDINYVYGRRAVSADGSPMFTRMFAAGELERQCVRDINPSLMSRVAVTGDILADELILRQPSRSQIREQLQLGADERVVMLMSSWGPDSLIQKHGSRFFEEAAALSETYRLVLSIHPNNWTRKIESDRSWLSALRRCEELGVTLVSGIDWQDYVIAADLFVADYTSLGLYASLMNRPMVMVPFDVAQFTPGSPIVHLSKLVETCGDMAQLEASICKAFNEDITASWRRAEFADSLVSHPGSSVSRIAEETYRVLNLEPWPFFGRAAANVSQTDLSRTDCKSIEQAGAVNAAASYS
ncbi:MAG: hypothetical protein ACI9G1_002758 [Pirellulaceae bacterium]|jgi:hypothetical protein